MDKEKAPSPAESDAGATPAQEDQPPKGNASVRDLLAAARGDVAERASAPRSERTVVTPTAKAASSGTTAEEAPPGDLPDAVEAPAAAPTAARVAPASGASKTTSTPTAAVNKGVTKAAARPPAAGQVVQSAPDAPINKLRRRIVWASVASFLGVSFLMFLRFFLPRAIFEPANVFRIGFPGDYSLGVDTKYQQQYRIWVVKNTERLFVITAVCTHLGCTPDWKASENKFKCPCHGSGYDSEGINFEGPAPRPMDRADVKLDAEGQIVVNLGKLYTWPKGEENKFNEEGSYIRV